MGKISTAAMSKIEPKIEEIMNELNHVLIKHGIEGVRIKAFEFEEGELSFDLKCRWVCESKDNGTGVWCGIKCDF